MYKVLPIVGILEEHNFVKGFKDIKVSQECSQVGLLCCFEMCVILCSICGNIFVIERLGF